MLNKKLKVKLIDYKNYIQCLIRKKWVKCTPEEWVRQNFIQYLINEKKYPKGLIALESTFSVNKLSKRTDILIYNRSSVPWMIVECKSEDIKIDKKTAFQAGIYNIKFNAKYLVLTNGKLVYCAEVDQKKKIVKYIEELPPFNHSIQ